MKIEYLLLHCKLVGVQGAWELPRRIHRAAGDPARSPGEPATSHPHQHQQHTHILGALNYDREGGGLVICDDVTQMFQ